MILHTLYLLKKKIFRQNCCNWKKLQDKMFKIVKDLNFII